MVDLIVLFMFSMKMMRASIIYHEYFFESSLIPFKYFQQNQSITTISDSIDRKLFSFSDFLIFLFLSNLSNFSDFNQNEWHEKLVEQMDHDPIVLCYAWCSDRRTGCSVLCSPYGGDWNY